MADRQCMVGQNSCLQRELMTVNGPQNQNKVLKGAKKELKGTVELGDNSLRVHH